MTPPSNRERIEDLAAHRLIGYLLADATHAQLRQLRRELEDRAADGDEIAAQAAEWVRDREAVRRS